MSKLWTLTRNTPWRVTLDTLCGGNIAAMSLRRLTSVYVLYLTAPLLLFLSLCLQGSCIQAGKQHCPSQGTGTFMVAVCEHFMSGNTQQQAILREQEFFRGWALMCCLKEELPASQSTTVCWKNQSSNRWSYAIIYHTRASVSYWPKNLSHKADIIFPHI